MWSLDEIANHVGGVVQGELDYQIASIATLQNAGNQQISFLSNKKYKRYLAKTSAGAVIVSSDMASFVPSNAIIVDDPYVAYAKIASLLNPAKQRPSGIHPSASIATDSDIASSASIAAQVVIGSGVTIADNVVIGSGCVILDNVSIGESSQLVANVTLCGDVTVGKRAIIHPGVVIGADGFGIANDKGKWINVPQVGGVVIGDDVDIGANTTIDRGAIEDTIIGNGVKLDNQIQVGHNTVIGENTVIAGCVGIAGSTIIGKNCIIGGGVGLGGHLELVDGVLLTGMTMVTKSIKEPGSYSSGIPAEETHKWHKNVIRYRQMDKLTERVKQLEKRNKD
ncbi:MAG: UDP-3-O-(3-hydroxymyristoyl)glucosamine N-acyltransferase [Gammaproteobacteria bacterium]|nr:UDP-3-O-(3-hydroxymyristoyl)glucosamine N-acyltransferase [Gammaproteobacteria bacterium]